MGSLGSLARPLQSKRGSLCFSRLLLGLVKRVLESFLGGRESPWTLNPKPQSFVEGGESGGAGFRLHDAGTVG